MTTSDLDPDALADWADDQARELCPEPQFVTERVKIADVLRLMRREGYAVVSIRPRDSTTQPSCSNGHSWQQIGGANCGCDGGQCSVPVHECSVCGDCDYGQNDEAAGKRNHCAELRADDMPMTEPAALTAREPSDDDQ